MIKHYTYYTLSLIYTIIYNIDDTEMITQQSGHRLLPGFESSGDRADERHALGHQRHCIADVPKAMQPPGKKHGDTLRKHV